MINLDKYLATICINQETKDFIRTYVNETQALKKELSGKGMRKLLSPDIAFIINMHRLCVDSDYVLSILNKINEAGTPAYHAFERLGSRINKINIIALEHYKPRKDNDSSSDDSFSDDDIEKRDMVAYPTSHASYLEKHELQIRSSINNLKVSTRELIASSERQFTHDLIATIKKLLEISKKIETSISHSNNLASDASSSYTDRITMDAILELNKRFKLYESSISFMIKALFDDKIKFSTSATKYAFYDALKTNYCLIKAMYITVSLELHIKPTSTATPVAILPASENQPNRSHSTDLSKPLATTTYSAYRSQSASSSMSSVTKPHPITPSFFALSVSVHSELPPSSLSCTSPVPH